MDAVHARTTVNNEYSISFDDSPMTVGVYTKKIEFCFKAPRLCPKKLTLQQKYCTRKFGPRGSLWHGSKEYWELGSIYV